MAPAARPQRQRQLPGQRPIWRPVDGCAGQLQLRPQSRHARRRQGRLQYTLADAQGANASSTLTIDIGQVLTANAGIVNLPAGVEMSDIHVVGRDLVIDMPDGTQMVIPDGAVFVPQLSIGDVAVPATNVAALLIDTEPQPAAGRTPSSGGNFAVDVPPLDPGVPLGDLIPPTELGYTPPEFRPEGGSSTPSRRSSS